VTDDPELREPDLPRTAKVRQQALRTGWTTGTCASAAAKAATTALRTGEPHQTVDVALPDGKRVSFPVDECILTADHRAEAVVVKDAGDDPDVTHGALVIGAVRPGARGAGLVFRAGPGVGTVTRAGLPLAVGEPAINPAPRRMIAAALAEFTGEATPPDLVVTISIPGGEALAAKTLNGRLGIVGGLSILGTTGIVIPSTA